MASRNGEDGRQPRPRVPARWLQPATRPRPPSHLQPGLVIGPAPTPRKVVDAKLKRVFTTTKAQVRTSAVPADPGAESHEAEGEHDQAPPAARRRSR